MLNVKILAKNQAEYDQFDVTSLSVYHQYERVYYFEQHHIEGTDVVVVLSPLTAEEQNLLLLNQESVAFLIFIGVTMENKSSTHLRYFTTTGELAMLMQKVEEAYIERLKQDYLSACVPISTQDEAYIASLANGNFHFQKVASKKNSKRINVKGKRSYTSKGMVTLVGNTTWAIDIVKEYQQHSKHKALFIDGNLLKPTLDVGFNIRDIETKIKSHLTGVDNTGINIMIDAIKKSIPINHIINQVVYPYTKSLDLLFGNYNFYNYEHYDTESLNMLIEHLKNHYAIIFIALDKQFYDELTLLSLHKSEINLFMGNQEISDVRFLYNANNILEHKQGISKNKNYFIFHRVPGEKAVSSSVIKTLFKGQVISSHHHSNAKHVAKTLNKVLETLKV